MTIDPQPRPINEALSCLDRSNLRRVPTALLLLASAYVVSAIVVSNIPGWNFIVRAIAAVYVLAHLLFMVVSRAELVKPNAIHLIFLVWCILGVVGGYDTVSFDSLIGKLWTVFQLITLSYFLYALAIRMRSIRWLEWSYLFGVFVTLAWVLITTGGQFGLERISGTQGNANSFAFTLLMNCVLSLDFLRHYRSIIVKSALLCNIGIAFPFILATGSRKGVIGFFLLLFYEVVRSLFFQRREKRVRSVIFGVLGIVLALTVCLPMLDESPFLGRFQNLERFAKGKALVEQENSLSGRLNLYTRGFELALQRPLFGFGLDQFRYHVSTVSGTASDQTYSHSNIIEVLADTGFIGFVIYHSAYLLIVLRLLSARKRGDSSLAGGYLSLSVMIGVIVIVFDLFSVTYYAKEYWLALTILLCSTEFVNGQYLQTEIRRIRES